MLKFKSTRMPHLTLNEVQSLRKLTCEDTEVNYVLQQQFPEQEILFFETYYSFF